MQGKLIILSAPSGAGKSTMVNHLLSKEELNLAFSISATCRQPRSNEKHGVEYYFFSQKEFEGMIVRGEFVEYEQVYKGCYYGTLVSEVERITSMKRNVVFDVDVKGGIAIKKMFGERALALFIAPPTADVLRERLIRRNTDDAEMIEHRLGKAAYEMSFAPQFDKVIVNDKLSETKKEIESVIKEFIEKP